MTGEVFTKQNDRKFIPVLARGTWAESSPSWTSGKKYVDLSNATRYAEGYRDLLRTILGTREKPPSLGALPPGYKLPGLGQTIPLVASATRTVNLELYDRRLQIYEAAVRLIDHIVAKGTCIQEELKLFVKNTKQARHLFHQEIESYLQKISSKLFISSWASKSGKCSILLAKNIAKAWRLGVTAYSGLLNRSAR
jgi:hypothetical protein